MISHTIARHRKKAAAFFFCVFYLNLTLPVAAHLLERDPGFAPRRYTSSAIAAVWHEATPHAGSPAISVTDAGTGTKMIHAGSPAIGGPGQPEMSSFKSVNANDMVDLFTGDFSYNIPLMDVGGYPVNIHYSSGVSMDQEASWVGLGWNINPGTIGRSVRGLPDDFDGSDTITKIQSVRENKTVGVNVGADGEVVGTPLSLSVNLGLFHNTYNGWGTEAGVNASISAGSKSFGSLTGGLGLNSNSQTGVTVQPSLSYKLENQDKENGGAFNMGLQTGYNSRTGISALQLTASYRQQNKYVKAASEVASLFGGPSASISFATPSYTPSVSMPYTSHNYTFHARVINVAVFGTSGAVDISGYVSRQEIKPEDQVQKTPAIGYLYYSKSNDNTNTLLDFNREKDGVFNSKSTPSIAIPQYTYDVYSISGEGTGGMFRPYRGDVGAMRDNYLRSKSTSDKLGIDAGFGNVFHGGVDFSLTNSFSENNPWTPENNMRSYLRFHDDDTSYQAVYFRNPGERTTNSQAYYASVGDDALMRIGLQGTKDHVSATNNFLTFKNGVQTGSFGVTSSLVKKQRDKRSQVISYLTAEQAAVYGLDKQIYSYPENEVPGLSCNDSVTVLPRYNDGVRKKNHLSQITVLNGDGRRYVYGLPAYNVEQRDVTFATNKETDAATIARGLTGYGTNDNTTANSKGKDNYFSKDIMPAYAHSFLLTGIVSPDYVDIKNDGITEDDMGDAVKFNYTRVYGADNGYFQWRTPYNHDTANINEGLKTYSRDDKGTYLYGKKEVWYLNSIESKTMIAVFKIARDRKDIYSVVDENGGLDTSKKLARLQQIDLYVKADLVKRGPNARPVKTVHFSYSYTLCKGIAGDATTGKLTLDSIWFSYNGNYKGKQNPYVFKYHPESSTYNPSYNAKYYDRWGNYQDPYANPAHLSNSDYPYAQQDSTLAAQYASVWTLSDIRLPSGGRIRTTYEADDYAYVQNKRATRFFKIMGVGADSSSRPDKKLYFAGTDNYYVFVKSDAALGSSADVYQKYLQGNDYIYFKMAVVLPADQWGGGNEFIPVYAQVSSYGITNAHQFWLRLKPVEGQSPLARAALQFLRLNLPSKAFPGSEPGDDVGVWDLVRMMAASFKNMATAFTSYNTQARLSGLCRIIDTTSSFVRLDAPDYKKYGGGLRVKKIEVFDNWNSMTGQRESVYGQQYSYTTTQDVNGVPTLISSGVASYEPMIGAEENPFRTPIPYVEQQAPMAPVDYMFTEMPLGESYFPSASVGYSKVRVRTINTKARSANGWAETEFYTTKDFPTVAENTIIDETAKKVYNPKLSSFLRINSKSLITLSQGFRIELNDMNGKVKAQASYAEKDSIHPISFTRNYYKVDNDTAYQPHLNNTVWAIDSSNGHINTQATIGKDIEVMQDFREQYARTISGDFGVNVDYFQIGPFPVILPSKIPMPEKEEVRYRAAATVKIVQRYGILDSVVAMDKGSIVSTKNLVYDSETGEVVLSRTNNEFNDPVYNFSYPAHWAYSGMGMAYKNVDAVFRNLKLVRGKLYYGGTSTTPYPVERFFESGDEVLLMGVLKSMQSGAACLQYAPSDPPTPTISRPVPMKAWVVDASKAKEGDKGLYFMDEEGNPVTVEADYMRILRSGHRNMLDASVGSIVSMASPVRQVSGQYKLVFDSSTRIINTSAVTYKDAWRVENFIYPKDTAIKVYHNYTAVLHPSDIVVKRWYSYSQENTNVDHATRLISSFDYLRKINSCLSGQAGHVRSYMRFDFSELPSDAEVQSATIDLTSVKPQGFWPAQLVHHKGCGTVKGYDWSGATTSSAGLSASHLKRVTNSWTVSTGLNDMHTTTANQVAVDDGSSTGLSCTGLITDLLSGQNNGIALEIDHSTPNSEHNNEIDYLSFCGENGGGSCTPPTLTINYRLLEDSLAPRCRTLGDDSIVNPYKFGLLGNWRVDRSYTFYHDRKESDASSSVTNIRKEGEIRNFSSFWTFTDSVLQPQPDTAKWVWNSASSMYSRKGYEIENYDPLGRYNAGLYGYNGTLPIAVAQNSRFREILFDGFEDYGYKSEECTYCSNLRPVDFVSGNSGVALTDSESHTGLYSIRLLAGSEAKFIAATAGADTLQQSLSYAVDSGMVYGPVYVATGQGLDAFFSGFRIDSGCVAVPTSETNFSQDAPRALDISPAYDGLPYNMCDQWFTTAWSGHIRPLQTDNYTFYATSDGAMQVYINGVHLIDEVTPNQEIRSLPIHLNGGVLYDVSIKYLHTVGPNFHARVRWSRESLPGQIDPIPYNILYQPDLTDKDTNGWEQDSVSSWCVSAGSAKPRNFLNPVFSPLQNTKLVVTAWVKMGGNDCNTAPALDSVLHAIAYQDGTVLQTLVLSRTGVRIEGWQRYEGVITVPSATTSIKINAVAPADRNIYVDDIRVQPYNSAMKNYVYDPVTLRLMAELDENAYATFYEYDDDGTLIRVKKETERGIMTVKETRSALIKE